MNKIDFVAGPSHHPFPPVIEGEPFVVLRGDQVSDVILVCDHAAPGMPRDHATLGLDPTVFHRHIAFDIGAAELTCRLSELLQAPAVLSTFSRLVIDPNRGPGDPTLIVRSSDGVFIPGNQGLDADAVAARLEKFHGPYHQAVERQFEAARAAGRVAAFVGIHSFTPIMNGIERPWQVAVLWNRDHRLARALIDRLCREEDLCVGENEPYSGRVAGYSMDRHGGDGGLPHAVIEVRQDLIDTHHGVAHWSALLARVIADVTADHAPFSIEQF